MAVHPVVRAHLDAAAQDPKLVDVGIAAARDAFRRKVASVPSASGELPVRVEGHVIRAQNTAVAARIYRLSEVAGPALLFFHGGGFVLGDLDTHDGLCRELCHRARCTVVSVDYRLAPEHPYPAAVDDALLAYQWLRGWEGVDSGCIAVGGDSAGAALAAAVALHCRAVGPEGLRGQLLIYPTLEPPRRGFASYGEMAEGYGLGLEGLRWFWEQYLQGQSATSLAAPALASCHGDLAPALVMTAQYDVLRDEGENYASLLRRAGNDVELKRYLGMTHGFLAFSGVIDEAEKALEHAAQWLRLRFGVTPVDSVRALSHQNNQRSL